MRLTVAIPTFNRNEVLRETLAHLLPQLTDDCELLIVDNHSDVPVDASLEELLSSNPQVHYRIVRNRANIGGAANILRCFELCNTPWIWLLGDDDHPTLDAVSVILQHLDEFPDCCYFNFASRHFKRPHQLVAVGCDDFVRKFDSWSNLLFMSVGVYHHPTVLPQLRFAYQYVYSTAPNVALLLTSLGEERRAVFSERRIIEHQSPAGWAPVMSLLGKMSLLDLPMKDATRRVLAKKLRSKPSLEATVMILLHSARNQGAADDALYQFDQICGRSFYYNCSWITKLKIYCYRTLVRFHRLGFPLASFTYPALSRLAGKAHVKFNDLCSPDLYQRM